jgi:hypothetical protein
MTTQQLQEHLSCWYKVHLLNDVVEMVAFDVFSVGDTVSAKDGGSFAGNVTMAGTLGVTGVLTGTSLDISGDIDVDGTTNLDVVDIDGAVDMASTLTMSTGGAISAGGANDLVLNAGASGTPDIYLQSGGATKVKIEGSDNTVTIGLNNSSSSNLTLYGATSAESQIFFGNDGTNGNKDGAIRYFHEAHGTTANRRSMTFSTANTERMRIDSSGYIYVNTSGVEPSGSQVGVRITGTQGQNFWKSANSGTGGYNHLTFFNGNGEVGSIVTASSATAYNTSSDYRLKENVTADWDATTRLKQLNPVRFNFIADADTTVDGFLAHEVQEIVPEAIHGTKDAMTAEVLYVDGDDIPDGKVVGDVKTASQINPQGIDQSKLVPLLVKTIQELEARITALENA